MSAQRLSEKKTRRIERWTGLKIVRAWAHGGYVYDFVTPATEGGAHLHGSVDKRIGDPNSAYGEFTLYDHASVAHYTTCKELFPDDPEWTR